jgi:hypothetical protein
LRHEDNPTVRTWLAQALTSQFAYEAVEPVRQVILSDDYDRTATDLRLDLIVAATLMEVDLPEKERWRVEVEKGRTEREKRIHSYAEPPEEEAEPLPPPTKKVGRNDPCPCGSGKKFKQCCMKKQG